MRDDLSPAVWRKSTRSNDTGECVEVADLDSGRWAVRDSKNKTGPVLIFTAAQWAVFTASVRAGLFD